MENFLIMFDKPTHTRVQTSFLRLLSTHVTLILNTRAQLSSPWRNYATKHKDKGEWEPEEAEKKRKLRFSSHHLFKVAEVASFC